MASQDTVTVATSATLILAGNDTRLSGADGIIYVTNNGANPLWVGDSEVVVGEGLLIGAGKTEALRAIVGWDLYGIADGGSSATAYLIR